MSYFRLYTILLFLLVSSFAALAQGAFTVTPDVVTAVKPSDIFVFYNYTELANLTEDSLRMRWVKTEFTAVNRSVGPGEPPLGNWVTAIQDTEAYYNPAEGVDSADFVLPPVDTGSLFIFQLFPEGEAGSLSARFKFFPIDNPADSLFVTFAFNATPVTSSIAEAEAGGGISVFPNPASGWFTLHNISDAPLEVELWTSTGQSLARYRLQPGRAEVVDASGFPPGACFIRALTGDKAIVRKVVIGQE